MQAEHSSPHTVVTVEPRLERAVSTEIKRIDLSQKDHPSYRPGFWELAAELQLIKVSRA